MILFEFAHDNELSELDKKYDVRGRRWVIEAKPWDLFAMHQYNVGGTWYYGAGYYGIDFRWPIEYWGWGHEHITYDGEHHRFKVGPLYINWFKFRK